MDVMTDGASSPFTDVSAYRSHPWA